MPDLTVGSLVLPCNQKSRNRRVGIVVSVFRPPPGVLRPGPEERSFDVLLCDGTFLEKRLWSGPGSQHLVLA